MHILPLLKRKENLISFFRLKEINSIQLKWRHKLPGKYDRTHIMEGKSLSSSL
jgi:hypothetical protein